MSDPASFTVAPDTQHELSPGLVEYADRLLLGTGLDAAQALRIARVSEDAPPGLGGLQAALRAGWRAGEESVS